MRVWSVEDNPCDDDIAAITEGVRRSGREEAKDGRARPIACFMREGRRIIAGSSGRTEYDRLFVSYLWVSEEMRGAGLGTATLRRIEQAARERNARDALIETLSDRTAAFYQRLGYMPIASIERYVGPFTKHVLLKVL